MLRSRFCSLALVSTPFFVACGGAPPPIAPAPPPSLVVTSAAPKPAPPPQTLSVLGMNDLHGRLRALPAFGGYVANVRAARAADGGGIALVDAGDMFQGTLESNLTEGASVLSAYTALGMTVATLGNHEFDFGPEGDSATGDPQGAIRARVRQASFPILSANLVQRGTQQPPPWQGLHPSTIIPIAGVRVGFVGLLTRETPSIVTSAWFSGLDVAELAPALSHEASRLRAAGAELVIAVAHAGGDCKNFDDPNDLSSCAPNAEIFEVARALPKGTVDAIFGGHSHAGVAHFVNGVPIVEAYARGHSFSRIDFKLDAVSHRLLRTQIFPPHDLCPKLADGGGCDLSGDYEGQPVVEDAKLIAAIQPAFELADGQRQTPLGCTASAVISGDHGVESPLGNLFADLLHEAVKGSDLAILNGGTLRADLPAGPLDYGQLFEAIPFDNSVARVRLSGAELKAALQAHLSHDAHGLVSVSGIRVEAHCGAHGLQVKLMRANGRPIADRETLIVATSDYLATGGDELFTALKLPPERIQIDPASPFRDALVAALKRHPRISPLDPALYNRAHPRLELGTPRPLICPN